MIYPFATWSDSYMIKANDPNGQGKWGAMKSPAGYWIWAGTIVAIPKNAQNKAAAAAYIKWCYFSEKGAISNRDNLGYFSTMKSTYEDDSFYSKPDEFYNGVDILKFFGKDVANGLPASRKVTKYDVAVNDALQLAAKEINAKPESANADELLMKMQDDIVTKYPDLQKE